MAERNLIEIIDKILEVAPDLKEDFETLRTSIAYTAPEAMQRRWHQTAELLNEIAINHPEASKIRDIFSGTSD